MYSANWLIWVMELREACSLRDQRRFGPNTMAKLEEVILFRSLRSITCEFNHTSQHSYGRLQLSTLFCCHTFLLLLPYERFALI